MTVQQKKPGAAFLVAVVLVVASLLYPLSFGPACFLCEKNILSQRVTWVIFRPITWLARIGPAPVSKLIVEYAELCGDQRRVVDVLPYHDWEAETFWFDGGRRRRDSVSPVDYEFARETE